MVLLTATTNTSGTSTTTSTCASNALLKALRAAGRFSRSFTIPIYMYHEKLHFMEVGGGGKGNERNKGACRGGVSKIQRIMIVLKVIK